MRHPLYPLYVSDSHPGPLLALPPHLCHPSGDNFRHPIQSPLDVISFSPATSEDSILASSPRAKPRFCAVLVYNQAYTLSRSTLYFVQDSNSIARCGGHCQRSFLPLPQAKHQHHPFAFLPAATSTPLRLSGEPHYLEQRSPYRRRIVFRDTDNTQRTFL